MDHENSKYEPKVQADNYSIAVGGINIGGDISGNITIGNTGYTVKQVSVLLTQRSRRRRSKKPTQSNQGCQRPSRIMTSL
jgi:hypothetical protein